MKKTTFLLFLLTFLSLGAFAQNESGAKEPDINEFITADAEPTPNNLAEIRESIGYPDEAKEQEISGYVVARILVDETGNYVKHKIIREASPVLTSAVEAQLANLTFNPATREGKGIKFWVNIPFKFKLTDDNPEPPEIAAIKLLTTEIEKAPEDYQLYLKRGLQYRQAEDEEKAMEDFRKSISLNPKKNKKKTMHYPYLFYANLGLGKSYMSQSKWEDAESFLNKAIGIADEAKNRDSVMVASIPTAYIERGIVRGRLEKYDQAMEDYNWAIENSDENKCLVHSLKYDLALSQKDFRTVVDCLDEIITCEPENNNLYFNRGFYKMEIQNYEGSLPDFDKVLEVSQNYLLRIAAHNRKALAYQKMKKYDESLAELQKSMDINVLHPQAYFQQGILFLETGKKEEACKLLQKALDYGLDGDDATKAEDALVHNCE